jgi:hypothetical protein
MSASNHQRAHHDQRRPHVKRLRENNQSRSGIIGGGSLTGTHGGGKGAATAATGKWRRGSRARVSGRGGVRAFAERRWPDGKKMKVRHYCTPPSTSLFFFGLLFYFIFFTQINHTYINTHCSENKLTHTKYSLLRE